MLLMLLVWETFFVSLQVHGRPCFEEGKKSKLCWKEFITPGSENIVSTKSFA